MYATSLIKEKDYISSTCTTSGDSRTQYTGESHDSRLERDLKISSLRKDHSIVILYLKYVLEWHVRVLKILDLAIPICTISFFYNSVFNRGPVSP